MKLSLRAYEREDDYWCIRAFLREVFGLNDRVEWAWQVAHLDYWRWHVILNCEACDPVERVTFLWEMPDGEIAAFCTLWYDDEALVTVAGANALYAPVMSRDYRLLERWEKRW